MADPLSTPRLTSPHLEHFTSRTIRLVGTFPRAPLPPIPPSTLHPNTNPLSGGLGRVTQLRGDNATLDSDGAVTAHLNRDSHLAVGNWVEVVGKVNGDLSVRVLVSRDLGRDGALLPRQQRGREGSGLMWNMQLISRLSKRWLTQHIGIRRFSTRSNEA